MELAAKVQMFIVVPSGLSEEVLDQIRESIERMERDVCDTVWGTRFITTIEQTNMEIRD